MLEESNAEERAREFAEALARIPKNRQIRVYRVLTHGLPTEQGFYIGADSYKEPSPRMLYLNSVGTWVSGEVVSPDWVEGFSIAQHGLIRLVPEGWS